MANSCVSRLRLWKSPAMSLASRLCSTETAASKKVNSSSGKAKGEQYLEVPVETSLKYMNSKAYAQTYGEDPVWKNYRRNFKGQFPPEPRKTCIRAGVLTTNNACPICRDENLLLDYQNVKLLEQFIDPHSGEILSNMKTGLCQKRHKRLLVEILKAKAHGLVQFDVPFRAYDYNQYISKD